MIRSCSRLAFLTGLVVLGVALASGTAVGQLQLGRDAFATDTGQGRVKAYFAALEVEFQPYPGFTGGVRVAVGDINGDGTFEVITGPGPGGGPHVKVFKIAGTTATEVASFFAFEPAFTGGIFVAAGNFDPSNDPNNLPFNMAGAARRDEIVVAADAGGGPHVKIFKNLTTGPSSNTAVNIDAANPIVSFFPYPPAFSGGVRVAAGDLNNDGFDELITGAGPGGGPHVLAFRNLSSGAVFGGLDFASPVASFFPFNPTFSGGVYVTTANWTSANPPRLDIVAGAGAGGGPHVVIIKNTGVGTAFGFDLTTPVGSFLAFEQPGFSGGVRVGRVRISNGGAVLYLVSGPGGSGFAKTVIRKGLTQQAVDFFFGLSPFDLSTQGVFVSP